MMPHMALSGENEPGKVWRPGREKPSHACGALLAVLDAIKSGKLHLKLQHDDVEMSLIKQEVLDYMKYGQVPDLTELTYAVHECIADRVTEVAKSTVNPEMCEYIVVSGIQVHTGFTKNFFWPGSAKKYSAAGCEDLMAEYKREVAADQRDMYAGLVMVLPLSEACVSRVLCHVMVLPLSCVIACVAVDAYLACHPQSHA